MKDFVMAVLPWVMAGLALAVLAGSSAERKKEEKRGGQIALGAALGLLLGVTLNGCGLWENHALGLALGPLWGMALASLYGNGKASKGNPDSEKESETKKLRTSF